MKSVENETVDAPLSAFCHISDYEARGYAALHRMVATSQPIVLWAPSFAYLETLHGNGQARVSPEDLLRWVEADHVRVIGREKWLLNESWRAAAAEERWEGYAWTSADAALKSIAKNDESAGDAARVRVVEDEDGLKIAEREIESDEAIVDEVFGLFADQRVPIGSLQRATRALSEVAGLFDPSAVYRPEHKEVVAREVIRDARNHARAIELAGVDLPFLDHSDGAFFDVITHRRGSASLSRGSLPDDKAAAAAAVFTMRTLLQQLEEVGQRPLMSGFIGSDDHKELARMVGVFARKIRECEIMAPEIFILGELEDSIKKSLSPEKWSETLGIPATNMEKTVFTAGTATTAWGFAVDPTGALSIAGLLIALYPIVAGVSRRLGIAPLVDAENHWMYMYAFGKPPTKKRAMAVAGAVAQTMDSMEAG